MTRDVLPPVIALDGPSGVGKGAVGRHIAAQRGWHYLDSGVFYRTLAYVAQQRNLSAADPLAILHAAQTLTLRCGLQGEVYWEGQDISRAIRDEACGYMASQLAAMPAVRQALLEKQRAFRQWPGLVADGRDMGTVVFPDAIIKIYLDATSEARAQRRYHQLKESGLDVTLDGLLDKIIQRDTQDRQRAASPLCQAPDAVYIDTTAQDLPTVIQAVEAILGNQR